MVKRRSEYFKYKRKSACKEARDTTYYTPDFCLAMQAHIQFLVDIETFEAVDLALDYSLDLLHWIRGWNEYRRIDILIPVLLLRLGRDQECYEFIKKGQIWDQRHHSYIDNPDSSCLLLEIPNADAFEPIEYMCREQPLGLRYVTLTALLKIKLLLDMKSLQSSAVLGKKVPLEILLNIRRFVPRSTIISRNKDIMIHADYVSYIEKLSSQVEMLYLAIQNAYKNWWEVLLNPRRHFEGIGDFSVWEDARNVLHSTRDAWTEIPGALEVIKEKVERCQPFSFILE